MRLSVDQVMARVDALPSLPAVVADLLAALDDERVNPIQLAGRIGRDQALAAKTLRIANSSFFGLQGKIATIQEAVIVLGLQNVRSMVVALALRKQFALESYAWFDAPAFWQHTTKVALCAKTLARRLRYNEEMAFTAGLLHDIGRLVLITCFADDYRLAMQEHSASDCSLVDVEQGVLGLDHALVGAALSERWKFAQPVRAAVAGHHMPDRDASTLTDLTHLANVGCHALDMASVKEGFLTPSSQGSWSRLGLSWPAFEALLAEVQESSSGLDALVRG